MVMVVSIEELVVPKVVLTPSEEDTTPVLVVAKVPEETSQSPLQRVVD